MSSSAGRVRVRDLPAIRDSIAQGTIVPPVMPGVFAQPKFAQTESMWWVSHDMTSIALGAADNIPAWSHSQARPRDTGVLVWAGGTGIMVESQAGKTRRAGGVSALGVSRIPRAEIDGVAWRLSGSDMLLFLLGRMPGFDYPGRPPLLLVDMALVRAADAGLVYGPDGAADVVALLGATWLLAGQPKIAEEKSTVVSRRHRRRRAEGDRDTGDIRVIDVRAQHRDASPQGGESSREYRHRWMVRGHWRQQACGPEHKDRKPVFIPAYIKGPEGAPFKRDEVRVIRR